jgi:hypothetical protein
MKQQHLQVLTSELKKASSVLRTQRWNAGSRHKIENQVSAWIKTYAGEQTYNQSCLVEPEILQIQASLSLNFSSLQRAEASSIFLNF